MSFTEAFFGSTQSQFTAYAIFAAIISICISIILTGTDMTIGNRFLLIFFVILAVLPSILLMLLQITCMVTGGNKDDHWWCWLYSWIIAIFVIIYCIFVVIISLSSLFTYNNAISKVDMSEQHNKMTPENSNNYAKMMINTNSKEAIEKFMNAEKEEEEQEQRIMYEENYAPKNVAIPPPVSPPKDPAMILTPTPDGEKPKEKTKPQIQPFENKEHHLEHLRDKSDNSSDEHPDLKSHEADNHVEPFTNRNYASIL